MSSDSPEEASEIRGQTLSPVSPKPLLYPSPTNIPILEKSMEPTFDDQLSHPGADLAAILQPSEQMSDASSDLYSEQAEGESKGRDAAAGAAAAADAGDDYPQALGLGGEGVHNEDTTAATESLAHFSTATASAPSDTVPASARRESSLATESALLRTSLATAPPGAPPFNPPPSAKNDTAPGLDIQALLDNLTAVTPTIATDPHADASSTTPSNLASASNLLLSPTSALPGNPNLPPRPPPQVGQTILSPADDIRTYHKIPSANYRAQTNLASLMTAGGTGANGLPPPPTASFQQTPQSATQQSPVDPTAYRQRDALDREPAADDGEAPWGPDIQKTYDEFLTVERAYVTDGQWDKFPANSRLFIGNLPTEKVTKRDIFWMFYKHGRLAQISIKQAYGFVQFLDAESCYRALNAEQGQSVRGRKMHLEISKPQRPTKNQGKERRRSRSPDHARGGAGSRGQGGVDRYTSGQNGSAGSPRERDFRRSRDDYRPNRSPSPRGHRAGRGGGRDADRYDGRRRSRSPYGRHRRSPSPRREAEDSLALPRRHPKDVPDVQILVFDDLDRNFIAYIERTFQDHGLRCDVLLLNPRLPEEAVVRRQILEGVQAVSRLTRASQHTGKISLQVFDRRAGADNVRFEEYQDLDPGVCAQLVNRAKQSNQSQPAYGMPPSGYGMPPQSQYGLPPAAAQQPSSNTHAAQILSSLNPQDLQSVLAAARMQQQQQQSQAPNAPHQQAPDLARILASANNLALKTSTPGYAQPAQQGPPYGGMPAGSPSLASLLGGAGAPAVGGAGAAPGGGGGGPAAEPDIKEIMAQLASYKR